jgi:Flp pilus assembly protein TadG
MKRIISNKKREQAGQSLVEMAITLTLLITLLAGLVDIGRAFFAWIAIRDAAQEGALYGSINPADTSGVIARARETAASQVDLTQLTIPAPTIAGASCANTTGSNSVTVNVTYNYNTITPFLSAIIGTQVITIRASSTNTIISPQCAP